MATTKLGLPLITGNMNADVVRDLNALANGVDGKVGVANGLATLGADGKVPQSQLDVQPPADASITVKGIVQLSAATNSTSNTLAATPSAVKTAYDKAVSASTAAGTSITDTGNYFTAEDVEGTLQEIGQTLNSMRGSLIASTNNLLGM
ncbi:phage tail protein [Fictibacillus sp. Mic-4]|uniref:phage tail protein n=1 Tax=Fictibacillus sp. Mic-4 TaxID=3132826 RepID=UPI003CE79458